MLTIPHTTLTVHPLCLGGNVFGWTAGKSQSFEVLDRYAAAGGNFVDSADVYSAWGEGNSGGESETILGAWMDARGNRDDVVVATKVGKLPGSEGLSAANIHKSIDASLERLRTDHIDLYYAHADDEDTPQEETLGAFDALVKEGKVRYIAASNFTAPRLAAALELSEREALASYVALQPHYNLMERAEYENGLRDLCAERELACIPYYALARGFLTGKYRPGDSSQVDTERGGRGGGKYLDERGEAVLRTLDEVADAHDAPVPAVALAWLAAQDTVATPIASARTTEQLDGLLALDGLELTDEEVDRLAAASS